MTDEDIRAIVRDAIARHVAPGAVKPPLIAAGPGSMSGADADPPHPSHGRFMVERGGDADGACVIEPAVRCTHCGYCQSYGH
jgi:hypothetical protein